MQPGFRHGEWPFVGREGELRLIGERLRQPGARGVVLAGAPGTGKTRLALEALRMAERAGLATARLAGTRSGRSLAFAALDPFVPGRGADPTAVEVLRRFNAAQAARAGDRRVALMVDDAHLLDDASAALLQQVVLGGDGFVILTVRSRHACPDAVLALWRDGIVDRLEVSGLHGDELEGLLAEVLGGPVDRGLVVRMMARSGGNLLWVHELVLGALDSGALARENQVWRLAGPLAPSPRLMELVATRIDGLDDTDRLVLEACAEAEVLGPAELAALAPPPALRRLEASGHLITSLSGRRLECRLAHPLYGDVLRAGRSVLRFRRLAATLAGAVEATGARRAGDVVSLAQWRLEAGRAEPGLLLAGAARARDQHDLPRAERLAAAAGDGFDAQLVRAELAAASGQRDRAEDALAELAAEAGGEPHDFRVAALRVENLRLLGRFDDAKLVAEAILKAHAGDRSTEDVTLRLAELLLDTEGPARALAAVGEKTSVGGPAAALAARCLVRQGRLGDADEAAKTGREPLGLPAMVEVHLAAGRNSGAETAASESYTSAVAHGDLDGHATAAAALAEVSLAQGRVRIAARYAREAASLQRRVHRLVDCSASLATLARAEAQAGRPEAAAAALAETDGLPASRRGAADLLGARAWAAAAGADLAGARAWLAEAARLASAAGDFTLAGSALHDLARLGDPRSALQGLADTGIEGEPAAARLTHVRALAAGDAAALVEASLVFERLGAVLLAAEAAADAAVAHLRRGERRSATVAGERSRALAAGCEGAATPSLVGLVSRARLTPTEREVALLAAAGRGNRDIAGHLGLSIRTVENHLRIVYEKLGLARRAELGAALRA